MKEQLLKIPTDGVIQDNDGRYKITLRNSLTTVAYCVDVKSWFTLIDMGNGSLIHTPVLLNEEGEWEEVMPETFRSNDFRKNHHWQVIKLPSRPEINNPEFLPEVIHFIWIGEKGIPEELVERMWRSARCCPSYEFILHAHSRNDKGWKRLKKQFPSEGRILLNDLNNSTLFRSFINTRLGHFYQLFLTDSHLNYAGASDILRLVLLKQWGGIYMDVDDEIVNQVPVGYRLKAGKDDVLFNNHISVERYNFKGYINTSIACQAGNFIIGKMTEEMEKRLNAETVFFSLPRPWYEQDTFTNKVKASAMYNYITRLFYLTGPVLFSDVLKKYNESAYNVHKSLFETLELMNVSPPEPRIVAYEIIETFYRAKGHYSPFSDGVFSIRVGSAHSWNPLKRDKEVRHG